jgi:hypothetical protein
MFPLREFLSPRVFYPQVVDQTSSSQATIGSWREEKKGGTSLGEDFLYWFELSLEHCISYL